MLSEKVLLTGKYLNAIYETGRGFTKSNGAKEVHRHQQIFEDAADESMIEDEPENASTADKSCLTNNNYLSNGRLIIPDAKEIVFTTKEEVYKQIVEKAYNYSSKVLLNLLLKEHKLIDRLR